MSEQAGSRQHTPLLLPQLNTLTHAYAYLMECGQMSWQELEQKAIQPYSCEAGSWGLAGMGLWRVPAVQVAADC